MKLFGWFCMDHKRMGFHGANSGFISRVSVAPCDGDPHLPPLQMLVMSSRGRLHTCGEKEVKDARDCGREAPVKRAP